MDRPVEGLPTSMNEVTQELLSLSESFLDRARRGQLHSRFGGTEEDQELAALLMSVATLLARTNQMLTRLQAERHKDASS